MRVNQRTSGLLAALAEWPADRISYQELLQCLGSRAHGLSILVFSLPCWFPMPPGVPTVFGFILLFLAVRLALGFEALWLPERIARRTMATATLRKVVLRALPLVRRVEKVAKPRWESFTGPRGRIAAAVVVAILAFVLFLPIPILGNMPPGIACTIIGLALAERDGLVLLVGFFASAVATVVSTVATFAVVSAVF